MNGSDKHQPQPMHIEAFRQRAEALLQVVEKAEQTPPIADIRQVFHELQVHQIELELQNEELRSTQKSLEESRGRFMHLFHQAPVGYVVLESSGLITEANVTFADMTGRDRSTLLGKPFTQVLRPKDRPLFLARFKALLKSQEDKQMELELDVNREQPVHVCISTSPHSRPNRNGPPLPQELFLTITDISRRKLAEDALQASEQFARSTVDALTANIAILDEHGTILFVNRAWREFARANQAEPNLVGEGINYFTICGSALDEDTSTAKAFAEGIKKVQRGEIEVFIHEYPCHSPDENRWFVGRVTRFPGKDDRRVVVAHENITQRKYLEEENLLLQRQLHGLEKEESLARMAGAIAHHFNNQLFVVMGNLELAMEGTFGLSIHSRLEQAMISLHKATELSSRMLTYLGINNRGKQRVDLSAACRTILNQLRATKPDQVDLVTDLPASGPMLMANHDQLRELLTNLVENSWEAMANRPGTIRLSLATVPGELIETDHRLPRSWQPDGDDYVCLQIEDSGCGMGPEDLERIFDPFYTNKFLGRGIGLPMVLGIARAHGGCVTVDSTLGVGTQVRVYLPIKLQQA